MPSRTEHGGQDRADALDREQVPVARVATRPPVQLDLGHGDLVSQHQHQPALLGQPGRVGAGQRQRVQQPGRGVNGQVGRGQPDVVLGQQRFIPSGCARCTSNPAASSASTAKYQP
jgi:hypothetical protein